MDIFHENWSNGCSVEEEAVELRRGPWTVDEDLVLMNYISIHGEGRWNSLAQTAGLRRTGKSCRLRWLNYLRPDVRRGNITPEEQLLILQLHSRFGNRWCKIAQHLPGRTDNEIKNYWRTRVQKHAKNLQCDVNSKKFKDIMQYMWIPRLLEKIQASSATTATTNHINMDVGNDHDNSSFNGSSSDSDVVTHHLGGPQAAGGENWFLPDFPEVLPEFDQNMWTGGGGDIPDSFWSFDDIWSLQQQQF